MEWRKKKKQSNLFTWRCDTFDFSGLDESVGLCLFPNTEEGGVWAPSKVPIYMTTTGRILCIGD